MRYNTVIWDLDGTLLDTLQDLTNATNYALKEWGLPQRTIGEVRQFVGNGVKNLILRAVPKGTDEDTFVKVFATFRNYYVEHCRDTTCLYHGIKEILTEFHNKGIRQAVVSNKLQDGVTELAREWFADSMDIAIGEREGINRKPARDMVDIALKELADIDGMPEDKVKAIYIGDSDVDIATARNSALPCISVLWGFRDEKFLREHGAEMLVSSPEEISSIVCGQ